MKQVLAIFFESLVLAAFLFVVYAFLMLLSPEIAG